MLTMDQQFVARHPGTGVIMSPRICSRKQIERHAVELRQQNARVLFDPQFYQPRTERENIIAYPYWDDMDFATTDFATNGATELCEGVVRYQVTVLQVDAVILPGRYTNALTDEWLAMQHKLAETAYGLNVDRPVYSTLAIGPDIVSEQQIFDQVLNEVVGYPVDGVYVVLKAPNGDFLTTSELYMYNLLDGFLSLALNGKKIILGYANQQSLIYAGAGVTGLATGNYRNVRSFDPEMFDVKETTDIATRAVWYYDANTLSDFRPETLGLAYSRGLAGNFGPPCSYCSSLLSASNPAVVPWKEPDAFRHYLTEMHRQWSSFSDTPTAKRVTLATNLVKSAGSKLDFLTSRGFNPGVRSFTSAFDPALSALLAFESDRRKEINLLQ